jgi:hypothetical protein
MLCQQGAHGSKNMNTIGPHWAGTGPGPTLVLAQRQHNVIAPGSILHYCGKGTAGRNNLHFCNRAFVKTIVPSLTNMSRKTAQKLLRRRVVKQLKSVVHFHSMYKSGPGRQVEPQDLVSNLDRECPSWL